MLGSAKKTERIAVNISPTIFWRLHRTRTMCHGRHSYDPFSLSWTSRAHLSWFSLPDSPFNGPLSQGSYGGTHAKRRHVTGIRIADDRWRFPSRARWNRRVIAARCATRCIGPRKSRSCLSSRACLSRNARETRSCKCKKTNKRLARNNIERIFRVTHRRWIYRAIVVAC